MPIERTIWCVISTELQLDLGTLHYWDIGTCRNHSFELTTRSESFRLSRLYAVENEFWGGFTSWGASETVRIVFAQVAKLSTALQLANRLPSFSSTARHHVR